MHFLQIIYKKAKNFLMLKNKPKKQKGKSPSPFPLKSLLILSGIFVVYFGGSWEFIRLQKPLENPTTIVKLTGINRFLRDSSPTLDSFSYEPGNKICLVPLGTQLETLTTSRLINGEVWYQVNIKNQDLLDPINTNQPFKSKNASGWILGENKTGKFMKNFGGPIVDSSTNDLKASMHRSRRIVLGLLIGLLIWKVLSNRGFDENKWFGWMFFWEAFLLVSVLLSAFFISLINVSENNLDKASEITKMIFDLLNIYTVTDSGALLVGVIFALLTAKIFSLSPAEQKLKGE